MVGKEEMAPVKPLEITTTREGDSIVISLSGELDLAAADDLAEVIREVEESEISRIVIALTDLAFADSIGLAALLEAKSRSNGRLAFTPSNHDAVTRVLAMTKADEILGL
jgi:anti-sigma B factor antagonist